MWSFPRNSHGPITSNTAAIGKLMLSITIKATNEMHNYM